MDEQTYENIFLHLRYTRQGTRLGQKYYWELEANTRPIVFLSPAGVQATRMFIFSLLARTLSNLLSCVKTKQKQAKIKDFNLNLLGYYK